MEQEAQARAMALATTLWDANASVGQIRLALNAAGLPTAFASLEALMEDYRVLEQQGDAMEVGDDPRAGDAAGGAGVGAAAAGIAQPGAAALQAGGNPPQHQVPPGPLVAPAEGAVAQNAAAAAALLDATEEQRQQEIAEQQVRVNVANEGVAVAAVALGAAAQAHRTAQRNYNERTTTAEQEARALLNLFTGRGGGRGGRGNNGRGGNNNGRGGNNYRGGFGGQGGFGINKRRCYVCQGLGHMAHECPSRHNGGGGGGAGGAAAAGGEA